MINIPFAATEVILVKAVYDLIELKDKMARTNSDRWYVATAICMSLL